MIYANVTPVEERIPAVLSLVRIDLHPYDKARSAYGATRLVALSVLDDRLYLSLDSVPDQEDLEKEGEEGRTSLAAATRWWRTVRTDSPGDFSWTYGPVPLSGSPSILDGEDLRRLCEANEIRLEVLDHVLMRIAQYRWPRTWGELPDRSAPSSSEMLFYKIPLFPAIVQTGAVEVDLETGATTPMEPT